MSDSNKKFLEQQPLLQSGWPQIPMFFPFHMPTMPPPSSEMPAFPFFMPQMTPPDSSVSQMPAFPFFMLQMPPPDSSVSQMPAFPFFMPQMPPPDSSMSRVPQPSSVGPPVQPPVSELLQPESALLQIQMPFFQFLFAMLAGQQIHKHPELWHPDYAPATGHTKDCLKFFTAHIKYLLKNPQPGADIFPDEDDATLVEFLLYGTQGTPYEGGFFHFSVRAPPDYPKKPPRVAFRTTSSTGRVRFNPNFYEKGCVCLSILGTWGANTWQENFTLKHVLHVLQSCLRDDPFANEPEAIPLAPEERAKKSQFYSEQVAYETLREAVCGQLERRTLPPALHKRAAAHFVRHYQAYRDRCNQLKKQFDGLEITNVYNQEPSEDTYEFAAIYRRLEKLLPIAQVAAQDDGQVD